MHHLIRLLLASLAFALLPAHAAVDVAGVRFDDRATVAGENLVLNGAGLRTRLVFKVYAMGLYLPQRTASPAAAMSANGAQRIRIVTLRDLGADQFVEALVDGLAKNLTSEEMAALQPSIASFREAMLAIGEARSGTEVLLDWLPGAGTRLTVAGTPRGKDIPGDAFYRGLLRIWLGEHPVQSDLKKQLLGAAD